MNARSLDYEVPAALSHPRILPGWRDLLQTWPGLFVGVAAGVLLSALYFVPGGTEWLWLWLAGGKFCVGSCLTIYSDRGRWIGLGLLLSIPVGVVIWLAAAFGGGGWCC